MDGVLAAGMVIEAAPSDEAAAPDEAAPPNEPAPPNVGTVNDGTLKLAIPKALASVTVVWLADVVVVVVVTVVC